MALILTTLIAPSSSPVGRYARPADLWTSSGVVDEVDEAGLADVALVRELGDLDRRPQRRARPTSRHAGRPSAAAGRTGTRRCAGPAAGRQLVEPALREPGADAAGERQHAVDVEPPDEQRAEAGRAVAGARRVAADDDLGPAAVLDLAPVLGPRARAGTCVPRRLAITPSSSWATVASSSACPSPMRWAGTAQLDPASSTSPSSRRRSSYGQADRVVAVDRQHVEHVQRGLRARGAGSARSAAARRRRARRARRRGPLGRRRRASASARQLGVLRA